MDSQNATKVTPKEKEKLDRVEEMVKKLSSSQDEQHRETNKKLDVVTRGLYGDQTNMIPGLMERMAAIEKLNISYDKRFETVERVNWKNSVFITIGAAVLSFAASLIPKLFK
jgi:hypothetical protein